MVKIITQEFRRRVKEVLLEKKVVNPERIDEAVEAICEWFRNHRREMKEKEMVMILRKFK
jgi:hemerythrin